MSGFDCQDHYLEHCYLAVIPRTLRDDVRVFEVYGRPPKATEEMWAPEAVLRAELPKSKWDVISGDMRHEFNRRLRSERRRTGSWSIGQNGIQRLLGKELLVLVWAIEQADVSLEQCEVALRNWLGLKPEERWWLYTMTAASTGMAHQAGMGWRAALSKALCFGTNRDVFSLGAATVRGELPPRRNDGYRPSRKDSERLRLEMSALDAIARAGVAFA